MPIPVSDPNIVNTPPGWAACDDALRRQVSPVELGFACSAAGELNLFRSRYRLAKSFCEIRLDGYSIETIAGYSSLFRVFLTYSAFEQLLDCCGLNMAGVDLQQYEPAECEQTIRRIENYRSFLQAVHNQLENQSHRQQFESFISGSPCNILYIAAGIRHSFAHGKLTPNSGAGFTGPAQEISRILSGFLFCIMDNEFSTRLRAMGVQI